MHRYWNGGEMSGFLLGTGDWNISYYDETDLPFYYSVANRFAIADRYFSSALAPTWPNRFFSLTGTSFGHIDNDENPPEHGYSQKTIFDLLNQFGISWKYYKRTHYYSDR